MAIGIVILAAGASTRMNGQPKQLLQFDKQSLLRRAANTALASECHSVVVVLGANAERLRQEISNLPICIVINEDWASGMGESLKTGLSALLKENLERGSAFEAVIVTLCDQPLVTPETINRLIETFKQTKNLIVASEYNDTIGVPALFAGETFGDLLNLKGDAGARFVIKKFAASGVAKIVAPEAAFDVDTKEDYELLLQKQ